MYRHWIHAILHNRRGLQLPNRESLHRAELARLRRYGLIIIDEVGYLPFEQDAANLVFPRLTIFGWTFDVEALFIARKCGLKIVEVPIDWHHHPHSTVNVFRDSLRMGFDLIKIRVNHLLGRYNACP